jgi:hypothetical protein
MTEDVLVSVFREYLKPVSTPAGFTSEEIVRRAIAFDGPPRIPYSFVDPLESDIAEVSILAPLFTPAAWAPKGEIKFDEWGVGWRGTGRAWGHADVNPLADLSALDSYRFPEVMTPEAWAQVGAFVAAANRSGKYVVGADPVGSYERLRGLMDYENLMLAVYTDRERFERLLDKLTDMTIEVVRGYAELGGVHGFMTWEDWGLQTSLQIRPKQWREIFKPRYARIVEAAHKGGMHYIWHSCGYIADIIPDMIEIGVDALQLDQPRLMGVERLTNEFGGKICFWNTVDIQWSSPDTVGLEEAQAEAKRMVESFGRFNGGFIARQYPQPADIGMSHEKHRAIYEAFMEAGCR